jgi:hypothetical protein
LTSDQPAPAGYSGTPLPRKLGIGQDDTVALIGAPDGFDARYDVIVDFITQRAELEADLPRLRSVMAPACGLWIAWPKKASGRPTDMTDQVVRDVALPTGLVDNKVCAIDATWSGLRLVIRRELREPAGRKAGRRVR